MCGILGLVSKNAATSSIAEHVFDNAIQSLSHRGPDSSGHYQDANVWLGHTRLSILDLSNAGHQPMRSADERLVISYNGEVYNFRSLAAESGFDALRSRSDTEVVLEAFAKFGIESFEKLNGMFAFAIYDRQTSKVWLVRDRLGIKPLYYHTDSATLIFGSEIKSIIKLSGGRLTCNQAALPEWLYYGNTLGSNTLYEGIEQLLPGHFLEIDLRTFKTEARAYWSLPSQSSPIAAPYRTEAELVSTTRDLLEQGVRRQLVSDVPVGLFLSGGVDSSAIAAFASRHYDGTLATYSAGFDFSPGGSELPQAKRVADLFGTNHHEIHIAGADVGDLVEKMVDHHDMPFSDAANIPLYLMAEQINSHTKVVLQGDGGDELFGGYRRYATLKYYHLLRPLAKILQNIQRFTPKTAMHYRVRRYLHAFAATDLAATIALLLTAEDRDSSPLQVFLPEFAKSVGGTADPFDRYRKMQATFEDHDISNQLSLIDLSIVLPDTYLEKVDRATMAASVEVRVPFLDNDLVEYVVGLPGPLKMPFGKKKWLLKAALRGIVPDDVLFAPKAGFGVPFGHWMQTTLKPFFFDHLNQFEQDRPGILDMQKIRMLHTRTGSGKQNHSPLLWKVLNFVVWANRTKIGFTLHGAQ